MSFARIAIGGIDAVPVRGTQAERELIGRAPDAQAISQAAEAIGALPADGDIDNPADYRQDLARELSRRALAKAVARCRRPDV